MQSFRSRKERETGLEDGGATSGTALGRVFICKGRGAIMFQVLSSRTNSGVRDDGQAVRAARVESSRSREVAATSTLYQGELGPGEESVEELPEVYECWDNGETMPTPPKQLSPQQPWWFPGWGGGYFPWAPFGMGLWEGSWPGSSCP